MAQFQYHVKSGSGKQLKGMLTAMDKPSAMEELRRRGLIVLSLDEHRNTVFNMDIYIGNPVKTAHFIVYCRQFATLIRAGVTIVDATEILAQQTESKALRKALQDVHSALLRGTSFSQAAQDHKRIFPVMFTSMIRAGEESGDLEGTLERLATFFEKGHVTREKIKSALTYPVIVGILAIAAVVYLLKAIVPQFVAMFESMNAELPAITKIVMAMSKSVENQWYVWILAAIAVVGGIYGVSRTDRGGYGLDYLKLKMPVFGKLQQKGAIAQVSRTLSSLYASSVPMLQSLHIVEEAVGNRVIAGYLRKSADSLRRGNPLSEPLKKAWVFPPLVTQMIAIGEETGALDQMLAKVADFYEMDVDNTVDRLKSLIEPLLIVFLAGVVGLIVAAIMLPMFSLYGQMG
ncbi:MULTISPECIES: type II secretion system F family protein [unclassified Paenibacillus]|uniref:type II secretion system F family protein n=1 Tax=unclassified Paenibacillus TaxID=185978 RepID=UPI0009551C34|nr:MULTISPECIES: type II secretion system F family protein [unclassified Paenibacillus]ASS67701.1 type II secretion system F family protein [Paenibacillus sp. RUD330]SIR67002.1 type IV pilus assembly protein PilC [Paenibacillus sp. RU4X]SIR74837.1 type IV pilus assembly protein PilC [Paenibacillus sp. RU4T]